ncbi:aromatic ring-hydroxylating dioxygenase subunit alpha [Brevundimonas goettingensis]|uniref:Aromatic ring-hydroxylating dioxygenase subunit alpha n=1 Tax=Brevundimonas goettingensis TaxID=2774190 RepID=A0A975GWZ6_9CAUL|nr:aromatic ring-hydroxylating dioxygenase subunit alpha [Brevundimonas goettingensis]
MPASRSDARREGSARLGQGFLWNSWYVAAVSGQLAAGELLPRQILGLRVLLGRTPTGEVWALNDRCPHRAVPLSAGRTVRGARGEDLIECPYHGWRFRTDGVCASVPANADPDFTVETIRVSAFRVVETHGLIWIWMTQDRAEPDHPPPVIPGIVGRKPLAVATIAYPVHVDHAILGLVDPAHGPYVHRQWWWRKPTRARVKSKAFVASPLGFTMVGHAPSESGRLYRLLGASPVTEIVFRLPGLRWEHLRLGARSVLALSAMTPVTDHETRMTQIVWSDFGALRFLAPLVRFAVHRFLQEDEVVITAQSRDLKDSPPFLWVGDADQQARWYVQLKREWLASRGEDRAFVNPVKARRLSWSS